MVRYNSISSCLMFALVSWLCASNSNGADVVATSADTNNLRGEQEIVSITSWADEDVWDYDFGITADVLTASIPIPLDRSWVKVLVTIGGKKFAAALSKYGLYFHPGYAFKIPPTGKLMLGPNELDYNMIIPPYNPDCPSVVQNGLSKTGVKRDFFYFEDTWIKSYYTCDTGAPVPSRSHCITEEGDRIFYCYLADGGRVTNLTDNTVLLLWDQSECSFTVQCMMENSLFQIVDASQIEQCYHGIFEQGTKCPTTPAPTPVPTPAPTPVPAPTRAPTEYMRDCGVPQDTAEFPEYTETIKGLGYVTSNNILGRGVQYHLVPSNPSSCPITSFNMFNEKEEIFNFPEGCDGYLYATLFKNLRCGDVVKMKFKYQQNGNKILHMTYDGIPFTF